MGHAVEGFDSDLGLGCLGLQFTAAQFRSDDLFVAPDLCLDACPLTISGGLLPCHSAILDNHVDMRVACLAISGNSILRRRYDQLDIRGQTRAG